MVKIHSYFDLPPQGGFSNDEPSMTKQEFAGEADINNIMDRYNRTGVLVDPLNPGTVLPQFGDYSTVFDFKAAQDILVEAQTAFDGLPALVRKRFDNDPAQLLDFLEKEENRDEAVRLGLIQRPVNTDSSRIVASTSNTAGNDGTEG